MDSRSNVTFQALSEWNSADRLPMLRTSVLASIVEYIEHLPHHEPFRPTFYSYLLHQFRVCKPIIKTKIKIKTLRLNTKSTTTNLNNLRQLLFIAH